jgi:hypothetical protein
VPVAPWEGGWPLAPCCCGAFLFLIGPKGFGKHYVKPLKPQLRSGSAAGLLPLRIYRTRICCSS